MFGGKQRNIGVMRPTTPELISDQFRWENTCIGALWTGNMNKTCIALTVQMFKGQLNLDSFMQVNVPYHL